MNTLLKTEEAIKFICSFILIYLSGFPAWSFFAWILAPDISMLGYLAGTRTGAMLYNLFHHQGIAVLIAVLGIFLQNREIQFAGILMFGHSSMDRMLGYGLKYPDDFKHTHLGMIGEGAKKI